MKLGLDLRKIEGVAFDFDGTLCNTYATHEKARAMAFADFGFGHVTPEEHALGHTYGARTNPIIAGVLKAANCIDESADPDSDPTVKKVVDRKNEYYREILHSGLEPQPGAIEFVQSLMAQGMNNLAIVTTGHLHEVEPFLERYNLADIFNSEHLITHETIDTLSLNPKPSKDPYILGAKKLGIADYSQMLVIEDSMGGVASGKAAGAVTLAVCTTHKSEEFKVLPKVSQPDMIVHTFDEIKLV